LLLTPRFGIDSPVTSSAAAPGLLSYDYSDGYGYSGVHLQSSALKLVAGEAFVEVTLADGPTTGYLVFVFAIMLCELGRNGMALSEYCGTWWF
jgi:hypothetical protein